MGCRSLHLEKLRHEDPLTVQREGTFMRYRVNTDALRAVLTFLYAECCGRTKAIALEDVTSRCGC